MLFRLVFALNAIAAVAWLLPAALVYFGPTGESAQKLLAIPWGGLVVSSVLVAKRQERAGMALLLALTVYNIYGLTHLK